MNQKKIEACERLCRKFLERAKAVKDTAKVTGWNYLGPKYEQGFRERRALSLASMELTRALTDLRRPEETEE